MEEGTTRIVDGTSDPQPRPAAVADLSVGRKLKSSDGCDVRAGSGRGLFALTSSKLPRRVFRALSGDASGQRGLLERVAYGRVRLERAPQAELLADLSDRREHFLAHQPDAPLRVLVLHEAVASPEADDGRACLLEQAPNLGDHGLRRPGDDLLVSDLVLERRAARIRPTSHGVLDERRAVRRREVTRGARPHGMG